MANNKAHKDVLEELHSALAAALLEKVRSGATAADLAAAAKFLKDNNITADIQQHEDLLELQKHVLPTFDDVDDSDLSDLPRH